MTRTKPIKTTFDRVMKNPTQKRSFEKSYNEFLLSELIISLMENDHISVRKLAKEVGISPTIIQSLRSGTQADLRTSRFLLLMDKLGYEVELRKKVGKQLIHLRIGADNAIAAFSATA